VFNKPIYKCFSKGRLSCGWDEEYEASTSNEPSSAVSFLKKKDIETTGRHTTGLFIFVVHETRVEAPRRT
jgi:hypothetical protein